MSARRSWLPIGLTLLAGVLLGVVGMAAWIHAQLREIHSGGPEEVGLAVLDRELDLDEAQEQRTREILHGVHARLAAFHEAHSEELHGILMQAGQEIQALLRSDQVVDWRALHERIVEHLLVSGFLGTHSGGREGGPEGR